MRVDDLEWDHRNISHIAGHHVLPEEIEELFGNNPRIRRGRQGYHYAYGQTDEGRYLFCVFVYLGQGKARPVTARDMSAKERRTFRKK